jgi:deoxyribodipyrimidine photolyase-related protein
MRAAVIYPHQLFEKHPAIPGTELCVLVEESLFFTQYRFHAKKLVLHRSSLKQYAELLKEQGEQVLYVECGELNSTAAIADILKSHGVTVVQFVDPCDDWLRSRLIEGLNRVGIEHKVVVDPHFLTSQSIFTNYAHGRKKLFFADFYAFQRKRLNLLLDDKGKPVGGKWSFDADNRRKLPRDLELPAIAWPESTPPVVEAIQNVATNFSHFVGEPTEFCYPTNHAEARKWLADFLEYRLGDFGQYEDAISTEQPFLFHSVLTPLLNTGLLSPREVVNAALERADQVPLNSLEGFIRQIIGWREYIRGVYLLRGRQQRSRNFWNHHLPLPTAFYDGTTGIDPVDTVIRRVLEHAYCHHIERLMIMGNFMLLCEINPNASYQWFMEFFIDSYDWVMVPNVYGMSQHADGGLMTTKPYISGSSYVLKMSDFRRGPWCEIWDALYWRFVAKHREFFTANPRMRVMVSQLDKMGDKLTQHQRCAAEYLSQLHGVAAEEFAVA